jgi:hypothetical protein
MSRTTTGTMSRNIIPQNPLVPVLPDIQQKKRRNSMMQRRR